MRKRKNVLKICIFLCLLFGILLFTSKILIDEENYAKYKDFYTEKEDFDVLFFGSSRMLVSVYPMQMYEEQGITSYNMAQHAEGLKITYWQIVNAIKYTTPKVIVVDTSLFWTGKYTYDNLTGLSYLHKSIDHMKLSTTKFDLLEDNVSEEVDIREYIVPMFLYHDRYDQLTKEDFISTTFYNEGAEYKYGITLFTDPEWDRGLTNDSLSEEDINLEKICRLCKEKNIELVLTYMPIANESLQKTECANTNQIEIWAKENQIPFLNFATEEGLINYQTDLYDGVHVNAMGGRKITQYLGNYLVENYEFSFEKTNETIEAWMDKIDRSNLQREDNIRNETSNLYTFIALINDDRYSYVLSVNQEKEVFTDPQIIRLLKELGAETDFTTFDERKPSYTYIVDKRENKKYEFVNTNAIKVETSMGKVEINYDTEGNKKSDIGGYIYYETINDARMDIMIFNAETGELITRGYF